MCGNTGYDFFLIPFPGSQARTMANPRFIQVLLISLLLLVGGGGYSGAGEPSFGGRYSFRYYGSESGLGNPAVWALAQDRQGFIWAGTEGGMCRFDGVRFTTYGLKEGLPSAQIEHLHVGPDGTLWVGTFKGLAFWADGRFQAVGPERGLPTLPITGVISGPEGRIWVGTPEGPYRGSRTGRFEPVPGWTGGGVTTLSGRITLNAVWIGAWNQAGARVWRWDERGWAPVEGGAGFGELRLDALEVDGQGRVWARSLQRLWSLGPGETAFHAVPGILPTRQKGQLYVNPAGQIWVATQAGLFHQEQGRWVGLGPKEGAPRGAALAILEDREGSLWLGGEGICRLQGGGLFRSYTTQDGLPNDVVWSIFRDGQGRFFVGTDAGLFRSMGDRWVAVPGTEGVQVRSIVQGAAGSLWITGTPEILQVDPLKGVLARYGRGAGVVVPGRIFRILFDHQGALWAATDGAGLLRGTGSGRDWKFSRVDLPGGFPEERIEDLQLDGAGRLWAGGERGLAVCIDGKWQRLGRAEGLRSDHVAYIRPLKNGAVLATYFDPLGVCQVRLKEGKPEVEGHWDDLVPPDRVVYMLGQDPSGVIWVGSSLGLDRIGLDGTIEHFGLGEGLVNENLNAQAFMADGSDIWVGTALGLARFDGRQYRGAATVPETVLLNCRLGSKSHPPIALAPVAVPRAENTFEVRFTGLSYIREGRLQFQARLLGLETEWHAADSRVDRYPALAPGQYRYEVRARIDQGSWGVPSSFEFRVKPAWWQTWWTKLALGLGLCVLVALYLRWRVAHLHRRNAMLEALVHARTQEVEAKAEELATANEALRNQSLTDPLTGLRNRRYLGVCMPEDVAQVNRIHRDAHLGRMERLRLNIDLVFIMVDLDHFKLVNDEYGHAAGDRVLQQVAEILRLATRDSDTVIRWGGEEFLIVARNASRAESTVVVERIRAQVENHPFELGNGQILRRTCSLGFTFYPFVPERADLFAWEQVVDLADHCLYAAKHSGRNAWVGVFPTLEGDEQVLQKGLPYGIPELQREGHLQVVSSLPLLPDSVWEKQAL